MPRVRGEPASQEEYEEWLGRLEEEEALPYDYDTFQKMLKGELDMPDGSRINYNDSQIDKLWEMKGVEANLDELGIHGVNITYPWGNERRYGIEGLQGLFGWETVQNFIEGYRTAEEVEE